MNDLQQFKPAFGLKNRHLQTLFASLFKKISLTDFAIETFILSDGDFVECYWQKINHHQENTPIAILFHGLAGSYKSPYIQSTMKELKEAEFSSVLMHFRGCSGKQNLKPKSYHSGDTQDAYEYISSIKKRYPQAKIFAVGFSLGANMLLKLLGEKKDKCQLNAAIGVSAPLQLDVCSSYMNKGFSKFYQKLLLKDLKKDLDKKYDHFEMEELLHVKRNDIKELNTFWVFDDAYTAPIHGFTSAQDYYTKSSAKQFLKDIQIPTLIIHAKDDPFMPLQIIPNQNEVSQAVTLQISEYGGHVGFISGSFFAPKYWLPMRVVEFLNTFLEKEFQEKT